MIRLLLYLYDWLCHQVACAVLLTCIFMLGCFAISKAQLCILAKHVV